MEGAPFAFAYLSELFDTINDRTKSFIFEKVEEDVLNSCTTSGESSDCKDDELQTILR